MRGRCTGSRWITCSIAQGAPGSSVRRTAAGTRSLLGRQERWRLWRPLDPLPDDQAQCHLSVGTVQRWADQAGAAARQTVPGQLEGVPTAGQCATDGLWARFRGGTKGVVLALVDRVTVGALLAAPWPPVTAREEGAARPWGRLFRRARLAGLSLARLRGIASDGAAGLEA